MAKNCYKTIWNILLRGRSIDMGVIRLFLALVVAVGHYKYYHPSEPINFPPLMTLGMNGGTAVMFFFVISGFLISFVLDEKYGTSARDTYRFYKSRFIRIYSLYWPLYIAAVVFFVGMAAWLSRPLIDNLLTFALFGSDWRLSFGSPTDSANPRWGHTALFMAGTTQAWTLATEVTFYLIAPFVLRSMTAVLALFIMSLAIRLPLVHMFGFYEVWVYYFFPSVLFFFLLGHLSRRFFQRFPIDPRIGALFLIPACTFSMLGVNKPFDSIWLYLSSFSFAAALPSVFALTKDSRWQNALGHLSYPVYLSHSALLMFYSSTPILAWIAPNRLYPWLGQFISHPMALNLTTAAIVVIVVTAVAALVYFLIEKPTSQLLLWGLRRLEAFRRPSVGRTKPSQPDFVKAP